MKSNRKFFREVKKNFTSKQVLVAFFATIFLLIVFRIGASTSMPGVVVLENTTDSGSIFDILNLLGGGGASQLSFFAVGISPYITAQIIIQLLTSDLIRPLANLNKSGEKGRKKVEMITRFLTVPFALAQGFAIISLALSSGTIGILSNEVLITDIWEISGSDMTKYLFAMLSGTMVSLFISDIITKRGVGNGITLIILSGILSSFYTNFASVYKTFIPSNEMLGEDFTLGIFYFGAYLILFLLLILAAIFINSSVRKIPIQQTGASLTKNIEELAYLPIKINPSGVIPVIFASSLLSIPATIGTFIDSNSEEAINNIIGLESPLGLSLYFVLIIIFSFFYSFIQMNPEEISKQFLKSGKYIPGIKAGQQTEKYISRILLRVNFIGAPALGLIAIIPYLVSIITGIPSGIAVGGTGIIIIVSASTDFWQSMCSLQSNSYYVSTRKKIEDFSGKSEKLKEKYFW